MRLICCMALVVVASAVALSQTPKSGALLTIEGTAGSTAVHVKIYDSQIRSGLVQVVPVGGGCALADQVPTDAYVLHGGSPTGCDPGDAFEVTEANNTNAGHQAFGHTDISGFHIETHYVCGGDCTGISGTQPAACNTSGTICASPDSGFITITNNTGSAFSGTISLTGTSTGCGAASDTTSGLGAGASVTLALGTPGSPTLIDSSNCGGFNAPQDLTLNAGQTTKFLFGKDDYQITPLNASGQTLELLPVPVPAGPLGLNSWGANKFGSVTPLSSPVRFSATNFPNDACIPYADFSSAGTANLPNPVPNPVCVEIQLHCTVGDCSNLLYTAQLDYNIDGNSLPGGVGGPAYLGQHLVDCPTNGFDFDLFLSFTGTAPTTTDPLKGGGSGTPSCYVAAFDPTVTPVAVGATVATFVGLQSPVQKPPKFTNVNSGSALPLTWQQFTSSGSPVTDLHLCPTVGNLDGTCNVPGPRRQWFPRLG
jgi:hypothetical protein